MKRNTSLHFLFILSIICICSTQVNLQASHVQLEPKTATFFTPLERPLQKNNNYLQKMQDNRFFERTLKTIGLGHSTYQYLAQLKKYPRQERVFILSNAQGQPLKITQSVKNLNIAFYTLTGLGKYYFGKIVGREIDNF